MTLISVRSCYRVYASIVLTITDYYCIEHFIRSLLNIIVSPILMVLNYVKFQINLIKKILKYIIDGII